MEKLVEVLDSHGSKGIYLTVHPNNTAAIKIYQKIGFETVVESDNYYFDNEARFLMKRKL